MYLLGFLEGFAHGQEDAVSKYRSHDHVIEVLIRTQEDAPPPYRVPRGEYEPAFGRREPVDVVLAEPLGHHAERLKHKSRERFSKKKLEECNVIIIIRKI